MAMLNNQRVNGNFEKQMEKTMGTGNFGIT